MNALSRLRLVRLFKKLQKALIPVSIWVSLSVTLIGALNWSADSKNRVYLKYLPSWVESSIISYGNVAKVLVIQLLIFGTPVLLTMGIGWLIYMAISSNNPSNKAIPTKYTIKPVHEKDLGRIVDFGRSIVGDNHIDLATLKDRFLYNQNILTALYGIDREQSLLGYFIIYPLNKDAYSSIMAGKICNGKDITLAHICKKFDNATALYIGMVGGKEGHAQGYVIHELIERLRPLLAHGKLKAIFTRGATGDGIRAVGQWSFQRLADPSEISVLHVNSSLLDNSRLVRHVG